jgi:hypothetical protein
LPALSQHGLVTDTLITLTAARSGLATPPSEVASRWF